MKNKLSDEPVVRMWATFTTDLLLNYMQLIEKAMENCGDKIPQGQNGTIRGLLFIEYAKVLTALCMKYSKPQNEGNTQSTKIPN